MADDRDGVAARLATSGPPAEDTEPAEAGKRAKAMEPPEPARPPRSERAPKEPKAPKPSKAERVAKEPKAPKPSKAERAAEEPKAPKPTKAEKAAKEPKAPKPPKAEKAAKEPKAPKPPKAERAPKEPKPERPPKPPKAERPPKPPKPASDREPLAPIALVASLLSATTAAVAAIPALLLARQAKRQIAAHPGAKGLGMAKAATVIAILTIVGWASVGVYAGARAIRPSGVDYATLKVGDCISTPTGTEVKRVKVVTCERPHDAEVFAVVTHPAPRGAAFPGVPALLDFATDACLGQAFVDYVGVTRIRSQLTDYEFVPGDEGWSQGRRGLVCIVDSSDGQPLTGSVKGTRR